MNEIYCVKCHKKTNTKNEEIKTTKNGRLMKSGICEICGTKKNQFIKGEPIEKVEKKEKVVKINKKHEKPEKLIEVNA